MFYRKQITGIIHMSATRLFKVIRIKYLPEIICNVSNLIVLLSREFILRMIIHVEFHVDNARMLKFMKLVINKVQIVFQISKVVFFLPFNQIKLHVTVY